MKFIEGRSLDSIIKEVGPLPIPMVQAIANQVGSGLGHAHKRGIVHRDVKPANIMVDSDGWAVVTDFGIAKVAESHGLTMTGATVGTPSYMSPEQCAAGELTGASDHWAARRGAPRAGRRRDAHAREDPGVPLAHRGSGRRGAGRGPAGSRRPGAHQAGDARRRGRELA